jgi:hypothetical protein
VRIEDDLVAALCAALLVSRDVPLADLAGGMPRTASYNYQ